MINSATKFKLFLCLSIIALGTLSIALWLQTPELFDQFNQAFCAH